MASFFWASCSFVMFCSSRSSGVPAGITIVSTCAKEGIERTGIESSGIEKTTTDRSSHPPLRFIGHLRAVRKVNLGFDSRSRRILAPNAPDGKSKSGQGQVRAKASQEIRVHSVHSHRSAKFN